MTRTLVLCRGRPLYDATGCWKTDFETLPYYGWFTRKGLSFNGSFTLHTSRYQSVFMMGVEPIRRFRHEALNLACLPFHHTNIGAGKLLLTITPQGACQYDASPRREPHWPNRGRTCVTRFKVSYPAIR